MASITGIRLQLYPFAEFAMGHPAADEPSTVAPSQIAELAADPERLSTLPDDALPAVLAALERLRARIWSRLARPPEPDGNGASPPEEDRLLDAEAVADRLGVSPRYVYDHADDWPFARKLSPRKLRFSERGLYRWLEERP